jgi:glutaminase
MDADRIEAALEAAVARAREDRGGEIATYIPELAHADPEALSAAVVLPDARVITAGSSAAHRFTYQSSAKLVLLAGLLEERGEDEVFRVVGTEPSGGGFASLARLETHGPIPANPLINPGAIALASLLAGNLEDRLGWIERWAARLYGAELPINQRVLASERRTGDRNRSIAYFLKASGVIDGDVDEVLEVYFALCSIEGGVVEAAHLAAVLARGGARPGDGERLVSRRTASTIVALMATCGMYDESGSYLVATGLPAKSGVSGVIVAVATDRAGIAVSSPRLNKKGGSVRGHAVLAELSRALDWHFALQE